jgi:hypothetical protein
MKRASFASVLLLALAPLLVGCGDDEPTDPEVTYDVTFTGDATFQGAHGGQAIQVAVVEQGGEVVAQDEGTVSAEEDPSFEFTFPDAVVAGTSYDLVYWIDSNFAEGAAEGVCEDPGIDHQWRIEIGTVNAPVTINDTHRPGETESVCSVFE